MFYPRRNELRPRQRTANAEPDRPAPPTDALLQGTPAGAEELEVHVATVREVVKAAVQGAIEAAIETASRHVIDRPVGHQAPMTREAEQWLLLPDLGAGDGYGAPDRPGGPGSDLDVDPVVDSYEWLFETELGEGIRLSRLDATGHGSTPEWSFDVRQGDGGDDWA